MLLTGCLVNVDPLTCPISGDDMSFNGVDEPKSPEFLQAIRSKAFSENKSDDAKYMVGLASLSLAGPALEWFEYQDHDVQTDWTLFRRALLEKFPASGSTQGGRHCASIRLVATI